MGINIDEMWKKKNELYSTIQYSLYFKLLIGKMFNNDFYQLIHMDAYRWSFDTKSFETTIESTSLSPFKLKNESNYGKMGHFAYKIDSELVSQPYEWKVGIRFEEASLLWFILILSWKLTSEIVHSPLHLFSINFYFCNSQNEFKREDQKTKKLK